MARVLVVDDAAFMRKVLTDALAQGGHEVIAEAANGNEAVNRFQELHPDVTTLDITMPEKDGLEALREILASDPSARDGMVLGRSGMGAPGMGVRCRGAHLTPSTSDAAACGRSPAR